LRKDIQRVNLGKSSSPVVASSGGELKIKGQAEIERKKGRAEADVSPNFFVF